MMNGNLSCTCFLSAFLLPIVFLLYSSFIPPSFSLQCYVWMTGFGNFSFFYLKRDFGFVRMWG
jgi:hypothetical protein